MELKRFLGPPVVLIPLLLLLAPLSSAHVELEPVNVPHTSAEKHALRATLRATFGQAGAIGSTFNKIARTGEDHNCRGGCGLTLGTLATRQGRPVFGYDESSFEILQNATATEGDTRLREVSHAPSGSTLINARDRRSWYMLFHFEDPQPGVMYQMLLRLHRETVLASKEVAVVGFSQFGGLWRPTAASVAPWDGSHLGTEGSPPDARVLEEAPCIRDSRFPCMDVSHPVLYKEVLDYMRYFVKYPRTLEQTGALRLPPLEGIPEFKPYKYGYPFRVFITRNGTALSTKIYSMGRVGGDGILAMPDFSTVYVAGQDGGLYKYESVNPSDLRSGTLYAAKLSLMADSPPQFVGPGDLEGRSFGIEWIRLGMSRRAELEAELDRTKFSDLFRTEEVVRGDCANLTRVVTRDRGSVRVECLEARQDTEYLAAFLEPSRFASLRGATTDVFRFAGMSMKGEGKIAMAAAIVDGGVVSVQVPELVAGGRVVEIAPNPCGCVFEMSLDAAHSGTSVTAVACGAESSAEGAAARSCTTEKVANPRSLTYFEPFRHLFVGEDSPYHENNFVWNVDAETGRMTRVFTAPIEAGITGINAYQDVVGGNNYVGINLAHPHDTFGWLAYFGTFDLNGKEAAFSAVSVPHAPGPKGIPRSFARVTRGQTERLPGFRTVFRTRETYPETDSLGRGDEEPAVVKLGEVVDGDGVAVDAYTEVRGDPKKFRRIPGQEDISDALAFTSLIQTCDRVYSVASLDSAPAVTYVITLNETTLKTVSVTTVDWKGYGGMWRQGGGSLSPWNTHIGGEAFEPNAQHFERPTCLTGSFSCLKARHPATYDSVFPFIRYTNTYIDDLDNSMANLKQVFNPYFYGYAFEVKVNRFGCYTARKHMALGRFSHGSLHVMPNQRTVYMTDWTAGEGVGGGLFKFEADSPGDLSSGTLYAAKLTAENSGSLKFDVEWIRLGQASNSELINAAARTTFGDIFELTEFGSRTECPEDRTPVNTRSTPECLALRPGREREAAFFETRRYAAYLGATTELGHLRGITHDPEGKQMFVAIQRIERGDEVVLQNALGSPNHVTLSLSRCGCVYRMVLDGDDVVAMRPYACRTGTVGTDAENVCNREAVANPTDMALVPGQKRMLIAEDSCLRTLDGTRCGHINNAVWAVNPENSQDTTRLLTTPYMSKISSVAWHPDIFRESVISVVVSEPYDGERSTLVDERESMGPGAWFGLIGSFRNRMADARPPGEKNPPICYFTQDETDYTCTAEFSFPPTPPPAPPSPPFPSPPPPSPVSIVPSPRGPSTPRPSPGSTTPGSPTIPGSPSEDEEDDYEIPPLYVDESYYEDADEDEEEEEEETVESSTVGVFATSLIRLLCGVASVLVWAVAL